MTFLKRGHFHVIFRQKLNRYRLTITIKFDTRLTIGVWNLNDINVCYAVVIYDYYFIGLHISTIIEQW
jgi:hypothetical protein